MSAYFHCGSGVPGEPAVWSVAGAGGILDGPLGDREILKEGVVEREAVRGAATNLEPTDLRTGVAEGLVHLVGGVVVGVDTSESRADFCQGVSESLHARATFGFAAARLKIGESYLGFVKGNIRRGESVLVAIFVFVFMRHGGQHNGLGRSRTPIHPYPGGERVMEGSFLSWFARNTPAKTYRNALAKRAEHARRCA